MLFKHTRVFHFFAPKWRHSSRERSELIPRRSCNGRLGFVEHFRQKSDEPPKSVEQDAKEKSPAGFLVAFFCDLLSLSKDTLWAKSNVCLHHTKALRFEGDNKKLIISLPLDRKRRAKLAPLFE